MRRAFYPTILLCLAATHLAACTTSDEIPEEADPRIGETRVFIMTVKPEIVRWVRFDEPLRYDVISTMHALLQTQTGVYLLETERVCRPLESADIYGDMRDRRNTRGRLTSGLDTLRGCMIETIYRLPDEDVETAEGEPLEE